MAGIEQAAAQYRLNAVKCIDLSQRSTDPQSRLALLDMARSWRVLADQADKNSQTEIPVYETPEPRQHVAQQQQQPQPDASRKEEIGRLSWVPASFRLCGWFYVMIFGKNGRISDSKG